MNSDDFYNSLKEQVDQIVTGATTLDTEARMHLRQAVSSLFDKLDIVTREEFDAQTAVLIRSREKIEQLQQQLKDLEKLIVSDQKQKVK
jgi:BMFP domain-containing protein YqiC